MRIILIIIVSLHGLIHAMGFVKAFNLANLDQLKIPVSKLSGFFWLLSCCLFLTCLVFFLFDHRNWWIPALLAIVISQVLIFHSWQDAKFGTIANLVILVPVIISGMNILPSAYFNRYKAEVVRRLPGASGTSIVSGNDLAGLPDPVKKYLHYTGVMNKPKVKNFKAVFQGNMKRTQDGSPMKIKSTQFNFFDDPARLFYVQSHMFGVPFDGFHAYTGNHAIMQIKVANLITVVDAHGEKMDQGETVTMFNDMCLLAPATLICSNIHWKTINDTMVEAIFTNSGNSITAMLFFNDEGALVNFISNDRFLSSDGISYVAYPWSTPVHGYRDYNGRRVPTTAEAVWHMPEGSFSYARFDLTEIEYNLDKFK